MDGLQVHAEFMQLCEHGLHKQLHKQLQKLNM